MNQLVDMMALRDHLRRSMFEASVLGGMAWLLVLLTYSLN